MEHLRSISLSTSRIVLSVFLNYKIHIDAKVRSRCVKNIFKILFAYFLERLLKTFISRLNENYSSLVKSITIALGFEIDPYLNRQFHF